MAQHSMSFNDILKKNVRHVYSGLPTDIRFRRPSATGKAVTLVRRINETQRKPPDRFERKFLEYLPKYDAYLPRAPALRVAGWAEISEIVDRVSETTNTHRRPLITCYRELDRELKETGPDYELTSSNRHTSLREQRISNCSLMRPTTSSRIRIMMRRPNAESKYMVRPCTPGDRLLYPGGKRNCCVPCRIIQGSTRPRLSSLSGVELE